MASSAPAAGHHTRRRAKAGTDSRRAHPQPPAIATWRKRESGRPDPGSIGEGIVIIRSHGVAPAVYRALKKKGSRSSTRPAPSSRRSSSSSWALAKKGEEIVIVGNPEHPEIKGLVGYSGGGAASSRTRTWPPPAVQEKEVRAGPINQDPFLFGRVVAALLEKTGELGVYNISAGRRRPGRGPPPNWRPGSTPFSSSAQEQLQHRQTVPDIERVQRTPILSRARTNHPAPASRAKTTAFPGSITPPEASRKPWPGSGMASNIKRIGEHHQWQS